MFTGEGFAEVFYFARLDRNELEFVSECLNITFLSLLISVYNSEEQEELLYQDSDVIDRRDNRCKVKWSREEVCIVLFIKKNWGDWPWAKQV